jgi:hypothetical protein
VTRGSAATATGSTAAWLSAVEYCAGWLPLAVMRRMAPISELHNIKSMRRNERETHLAREAHTIWR